MDRYVDPSANVATLTSRANAPHPNHQQTFHEIIWFVNFLLNETVTIVSTINCHYLRFRMVFAYVTTFH